jgi:hypothetical protein
MNEMMSPKTNPTHPQMILMESIDTPAAPSMPPMIAPDAIPQRNPKTVLERA